MAKRSPARQAELKVNYTKLREAGYSPKEASRLRSASNDTITKALHTNPKKFRDIKPLSEKHARSGGGQGTRHTKKGGFQAAPPTYPPIKGRIKKSDYQPMENAPVPFDNDIAYLMTYVTVDRNGVETRHYFTILPDEKMTQKALKDFVKQECQNPGNISTYQSKLVTNSVQLIGAYIRD